jgi:hypothetical protein
MDALINKLTAVKTWLKPENIWLNVFAKPEIRRFVTITLIQEEQLFNQGIDETGGAITNKDNGRTTYSKATEILTNGRKKEGEHYTLLDGGDFYKSMVITLGTNFFEINADPIKDNDNLFTKFGEGIIGLTDESKTKLAERLRIEYKREVERILSQY